MSDEDLVCREIARINCSGGYINFWWKDVDGKSWHNCMKIPNFVELCYNHDLWYFLLDSGCIGWKLYYKDGKVIKIKV